MTEKKSPARLIQAILMNDREVFVECLEAGAYLYPDEDFDPDEVCNDNDARVASDITPLELAISEGRDEMAFELIEWGAGVNVVGLRGWTPLLHAMDRRAFDLASALLAKGADIDFATSDEMVDADHGECAASRAVTTNDVDGLAFLIKHKADLTIRGMEDESLLAQALMAGHEAIARLLLTQPELPLDEGEEPAESLWTAAILGGSPACVDVLIEHRIGLESATASEMATSVIDDAIRTDNAVLVDHLISRYDVDQSELVHRAVFNHSPDVLKWLLDEGADLSERSGAGWTPRDLASQLQWTQGLELIDQVLSEEALKSVAPAERSSMTNRGPGL